MKDTDAVFKALACLTRHVEMHAQFGQADEMRRLQCSLPWERLTKANTFEGADGTETLADLFAGRSQLISANS
jgi:predicted dithiol-disulfide oxidoreductase (DUF899 family)